MNQACDVVWVSHCNLNRCYNKKILDYNFYSTYYTDNILYLFNHYSLYVLNITYKGIYLSRRIKQFNINEDIYI